MADDEAYTVFCIGSPLCDREGREVNSEEWLDQHRREVASLLTQEPRVDQLSRQEASESTDRYLSYYRRNLSLFLVFHWGMAYARGMTVGERNTLRAVLLLVILGGISEPRAEEAAPLQDSPYKVILERNSFNLKPPPTNIAASTTPTNAPGPKPIIMLSGISVTHSGKWAWFVLPPVPGKSTNTEYWRLQEGGVQGAIRVLEINARERAVKILDDGAETTLTLYENSPAAPVALAAPPAGAPGAKPGAKVGVPTPPAGNRPTVLTPVRPTTVPGSTGISRSGGQTSLAGRAASAGGATLSSAGGATVSISPGQTIPSRTVRTQTDAAAEPTPDAAEQWLRLKMAEAEAKSKGIVFPPVPPVPGGPAEPVGPGE